MEIAAPEPVRRHLEKVLVSAQLGKSETSRRLLTYLVERSVRNDAPKETEIAIDVFGRDASFNGAEDSLVRVGVRTLRQKLMEYYAGPGTQDEVQFVIPKGAYRVQMESRPSAQATRDGAVAPGVSTDGAVLQGPSTTGAAPSSALSLSANDAAVIAAVRHLAAEGARPPGARLRWAWVAAVAAALLIASSIANLYLWNRSTLGDAAEARIRQSPVWSDLYASSRTLTIVLGDLFMYTQIDPQTGRTLTVRDSEINSSEELRAFLATHPTFSADRGQRYTTLIPKSAAVGMAAILPIVVRAGRHVEVRILDELQVDDLRNNDIIFVGTFVRLGPLAGHYLLRSRYEYDGEKMTLTDRMSHETFVPEGALGNQRMDYGLAAKFAGPTGNHIMIFTSVGRNAGLLQIVRTLTSPEGLDAFEAKLRSSSQARGESFEALLAVTGFKRTDLAAEVVDVHALASPHPERGAAVATSRRER